MTIHVLVEGPSEQALFERWAPRLRSAQPVRVHAHQGKGKLPADPSEVPERHLRGLLDQLPAKLRAFQATLDPSTDAVVVLVDADRDDHDALERSIVAVARAIAPGLQVRVQLAIEETEAFYLGDLDGLARAFPDADLTLARGYEPDSICGTWELFGRVVGDGGGNKVAWAEAMGPVLTTRAARSRSPSFRALVNALLALAPSPGPPPKRRNYRHPARSTKRGRLSKRR